MKATKNNISKNNLSNKRKIYFLITSFIVGVIIFSVAYMGMKTHTGLGIFDRPLLSWMINNRNDFITIIAKFVTNLASPWFSFIAVALIVSFWALLKREIIRPLLLAVSMIVAALVSMSLKAITMNIRPDQINMIPQFEINYSFPSGHTIAIAVFLLVMGYLIYSRKLTRNRFYSWIIYATIGTGLIALSRLYLGYHWLTDVVASIGLSLMILTIVIIIDILINRNVETKISSAGDVRRGSTQFSTKL